jgi:exosortase K
MSRKTIWSAQLAVLLLCALALKVHYSIASPNDLRWILAPTTVLVEMLTSKSFEFESYTGYMSSDRSFVIAAPCAGVNFLLTAFLMLGLRRLWRARFERVSWRFIPIAAAVAYVATLIANTVRICVALEIERRSLEISWLTANQLHRVEGIVVYFGFLLVLFLVTERLDSTDRGSLLRVLMFPLVIYYTTTLAVPLANGSYREYADFWEHFVFVLVLPLFLIAPLLLQQMMPRKSTKSQLL